MKSNCRGAAQGAQGAMVHFLSPLEQGTKKAVESNLAGAASFPVDVQIIIVHKLGNAVNTGKP